MCTVRRRVATLYYRYIQSTGSSVYDVATRRHAQATVRFDVKHLQTQRKPECWRGDAYRGDGSLRYTRGSVTEGILIVSSCPSVHPSVCHSVWPQLSSEALSISKLNFDVGIPTNQIDKISRAHHREKCMSELASAPLRAGALRLDNAPNSALAPGRASGGEKCFISLPKCSSSRCSGRILIESRGCRLDELFRHSTGGGDHTGQKFFYRTRKHRI
ncbi:hypothetical protein EVAR_13048_1 [Eumeta japonica]|uniref:Uncharacterized protein n=1 Tax=Eumeta variegata TaxID=151549 RepID=A0A4C1VFU7_EUMVA|nr:hypothetical protein EVAR_13048_1 [Eumeta japonica]